MMHTLKTWIPYFEEVYTGNKRFELRKNDRDFNVDDYLQLQEFNNDTQEYTGREAFFKINYILQGGQFGLDKDYCILSI